jgi:hypothetical protein
MRVWEGRFPGNGRLFYLAIVADFGFCIHTIKLSDACGIPNLMFSLRRAAVQ